MDATEKEEQVEEDGERPDQTEASQPPALTVALEIESASVKKALQTADRIGPIMDAVRNEGG